MLSIVNYPPDPIQAHLHMNPHREEALFVLALGKPAEKRTAFLDAMCDGDVALRARLEALLAAHAQTETLMATKVDAHQP